MNDNMEPLKDKSVLDDLPATRLQDVPSRANQVHNEGLQKNNKSDNSTNNKSSDRENYSLNDDRRVKVLSPGALVAKRFFRNRLAVTGLTILLIMFLFSFVGALVSPYEEDQLFYRTEGQRKDYAGVILNDEYRYTAADDRFNSVLQAQSFLAIQTGKETFTYRDVEYGVAKEGENFYSVSQDGELIGLAFKDVIAAAKTNLSFSFEFQHEALKAYTNSLTAFTADGKEYTLNENDAIVDNGEEIAFVSRYVIQVIMPDVFLGADFRQLVEQAITDKAESFVYIDESGKENRYYLEYEADKRLWNIKQDQVTTVYDTYAKPSLQHPLGTDRNGMDMMTRLMYGGRISLMIGFIVVIMETVLGIIFGGLAGYFGGWVDNLIMRIVDVFYCIPSLPLMIILGAMMDELRVDPTVRMVYLMLILGFLGWPGIARMVRGQILSLREQEFMTATEACGIRVSRRIFKHLIPNVIPQLIVICTMGLGSTIITEATLSFLGLGVRFPFASWGNIINDVNSTYVLTTHLHVWIPAGVCLLVTVLAFNLVGDGLRDAFDPKMKR